MNFSVRFLVRPVMFGLLLVGWLRAVFDRSLTLGQAVGQAMGWSVLILVSAVLLSGWLKRRARRFIQGYVFPSFLRQKLRAQYPQLDDAALRDVERGLRQFFLVSAGAGGRLVAMPSRVVDTLWHEFILHTRGYEGFCQRAFGQLLHHTPAEALGRKPDDVSRRVPPPGLAAGLRRAWSGCCREEGLPIRQPPRLPLLFALDATLGIAGGYHYALDCNKLGADRGDTHCATDLSCGSGGGGHGLSSVDDDAAGGDGGGDGGGCGGGGGD